MKINIKRTSSVADYDCVQWSSAGVVERYTSGTFAGIVTDCRDITIDVDGTDTTYDICTLITAGQAQARISGTAPQNGSTAYLSGERVASSGSTSIGLIVARSFPENGDYADNDLVNIVIS